MTRQQVEAILGGPSGDYFRWDRVVPVEGSFTLPDGVDHTKISDRLWIADEFAIFVVFDEFEKVCLVQPSEVYHRRRRGFYIDGKQVLPRVVCDWFGWKGDPKPVENEELLPGLPTEEKDQ